jgi:hypothetical protein
MARYKVIWFDDEFDSLNIIQEKAYLNDIELIGYSNAKTGIEELERNIRNYDAAIIDGLFFTNANQSGVPTSDKALFDVAMTLEKLAAIKKLPWFILSGQLSFTREKNRFADGFKNNQVYDKLNDHDLEKLWSDIKIEADSQTETQIRHDFSRVFQVCQKDYIGEETAASILAAIRLSQASTPFDTKDAFTSLRKILELLFEKLNCIGLIPDEVYKASGWFNPCGYFLSGTHKYFKIKEGVVHPAVAFLINQIVQVTQDASHNIPDKLKLSTDEFIKHNQTTYLFKSTLLQLLDVLIWFKDFIDQHPDSKLNTQLWEPIPLVTTDDGQWKKGSIIRIAENGWGTFKPENQNTTLSIPPKMVSDNALIENAIIAVRTEPSPDGTKTFIKEIRKI